jgi:selenide, water dikinase
LAGLPQEKHPDVLVGLDTSDDAGVVRLSPELALIQTLDFFTPIVDDPYDFGRIAAANALSDVYAMGGTPLTAMNILCFPIKELPGEVLAEILRGGADQLRLAGVHLAGGHSVDDPEPKFGLSVTGTIHPERITTNAGARPGDLLVLTKPLGTGILMTAAKFDKLDDATMALAVESMAALNAAAAAAMREVGITGSPKLAPPPAPNNGRASVGISAATDITGFGLLGHLSHIARQSGVRLRLENDAIPILPRACELAEAGFVTGGGISNAEYLADLVTFAPSVPLEQREVFFDPQTSGGLCIAVAPAQLGALLAALQRNGVTTRAVIGRVEAGAPQIMVE